MLATKNLIHVKSLVLVFFRCTAYSWSNVDQFCDNILTQKLDQGQVDGLSMLRKSVGQLSHCIECAVSQGWVRGRHQWQQGGKYYTLENEPLTTVVWGHIVHVP